MDKKLIIIPIAILSLIFFSVFAHEFGHFYTAKIYGFENPKMHFFTVSSDTRNNNFFTRAFAYTTYDNSGNSSEIIDRKVTFAGLTFELFFLCLIAGISLVITIIREDWLLFIFITVIFAVICGMIVGWNVFHIINESDLYYLINGG